MKKNIALVLLLLSTFAASNAGAVTLSGGGCNTWGLSTYLFVNEGTSLVLVNGSACFISNPTGSEAARLAAVISQAQASGKKIVIGTGSTQGGGSANGLVVAMQQ